MLVTYVSIGDIVGYKTKSLPPGCLHSSEEEIFWICQYYLSSCICILIIPDYGMKSQALLKENFRRIKVSGIK